MVLAARSRGPGPGAGTFEAREGEGDGPVGAEGTQVGLGTLAMVEDGPARGRGRGGHSHGGAVAAAATHYAGATRSEVGEEEAEDARGAHEATLVGLVQGQVAKEKAEQLPGLVARQRVRRPRRDGGPMPGSGLRGPSAAAGARPRGGAVRGGEEFHCPHDVVAKVRDLRRQEKSKNGF